jgi:glycerol-3-phosphate acyltransferase PlsY
VIVFLLDLSKGFLPTYFAMIQGYTPPVIILTVALIVVGHCWPIFAQFRGGMGLAAAGGAFLAINLIGGLITLAVLILFVLLYGHAARGSAAAAITLAPVLWLAGYRDTLFWTTLVVGWILAARFYHQDWNREYRQLWLDKEE